MMRHISKKKVILAAAVMCVMMSMAALAGGKVAGWVSGTNPNKPDITAFAELKKAESHMGAKIQAVEKFSNGFQFDRGFNQTVKEMDENNQVMGTFPSVNLRYTNGSHSVNLYMNPIGKDDGSEKHAETRIIAYNGVSFTFTKDYYKFVPVGYEVTEEDQAAMDAGKLYISYGSDKVEQVVYSSVQWESGLNYLLMVTGDDGVSEEALIQMAKEIVDAG